MQFTVYSNTGKSAVYPLLPVEKYSGSTRPERLVPLVRLNDGNEYAVMTHEMASIPARSLGTMFCDASLHRIQVKAAIDFLLDGI
ncbi:CcdB family protein [Salmonella enterica subsp. enterica serovar Saintpaul]|uniref:Toxin CcdB n=1 Tax=Salmonella enterica TaxID=28901 RepID=A0A5V3AV90_SALER|nr:CcdB family protein [Salmonella enterica]EBX0087343.1 plasmid maintenance protein CcdB [Salmonella enterica subsp. enterica serovar Miami]ECC8720522.1 plasmid maintenance protein CcdB [Salmonella enterica subsp. houtenae]ECT1737370.1 plasmid maintenance protein CcdB [Salmonella enterica subsp. enterica serovar Saintpaul]ECT9565159.1 plasmid maintenance protein CcdB [Salmonella enterica subsp. enterica serovar Newport]EEI9370078.1 plasmid maintenance protein CcdB [Salmonella enterica subsp. 